MGDILHSVIRLMTFKGNKVLDTRANLVFQRLQRFYQTFNIISTLLGGLSLAVLTFDEFHGAHEESLFYAAEGLLTSSALTAVVAVTVATMLLFRFDGHKTPTVKELVIAWSPLVLVDIVILEFLLGLLLWYAGKNSTPRGAIMSSQMGIQLMFILGLALWMWNSMKVPGGLGSAEAQRTTNERVADKQKADQTPLSARKSQNAR